MNPLSFYFSRACIQSRAACSPAQRVIPRSVLSPAACSVVSAFSERHAYSRCTEDRRYFNNQITAHCNFNMKHDIKHAEDYHRRQSCAPSVETLDFTVCICSTSTFLYFDLYLNSVYAQTFIYNYVYIIATT